MQCAPAPSSASRVRVRLVRPPWPSCASPAGRSARGCSWVCRSCCGWWARPGSPARESARWTCSLASRAPGTSSLGAPPHRRPLAGAGGGLAECWPAARCRTLSFAPPGPGSVQSSGSRQMSPLPEPEPRSEVGARAATAGLDRRALDDLLAALAGLDSQERNARLAEAGAGSGLRDELLSRVATGAATGPLAESEEARGGDAAEAPRPGARVGPYRLERELAQGGMGTVYQAVRADDAYRKQVAVKLLRAPVPAPELLARFRAERQILAQLDHPHIARLLDGGRTKDGVPYLVMEFVQGQPITESCDRRRLAIAERVRLLATVCAAVQYAHQNLVIHRDLKPSNILVGEDGLPKLLDFGIAKLLR